MLSRSSSTKRATARRASSGDRRRVRTGWTPRCAGRDAWRIARWSWDRRRPPRTARRSVASLISLEAPPMMPARPSSWSSPSTMTQSSPGVAESPARPWRARADTPSRVCSDLASARATYPNRVAGHEGGVVGMGGLAEFEHHEVGGVDHVGDRAACRRSRVAATIHDGEGRPSRCAAPTPSGGRRDRGRRCRRSANCTRWSP